MPTPMPGPDQMAEIILGAWAGRVIRAFDDLTSKECTAKSSTRSSPPVRVLITLRRGGGYLGLFFAYCFMIVPVMVLFISFLVRESLKVAAEERPSSVEPPADGAGYVVRIDGVVTRLPKSLLSRRVADEELGDVLDQVEERAATGTRQFELVLFYLHAVLVAIFNTQRDRLTRVLTLRQTK